MNKWTPCIAVLGGIGCSLGYASEIVRQNALELPPVTVIASKVDSTNASQSTLTQDDITTQQASTTQELLDTLPGVAMAGSPRPGSQTINIRGFGTYDVEDVQLRLDGAPKLFQKYQQGSLFLEPELLKSVEVNKGPHSALYSNGGTGGVVNMTTKDADDLLLPGQEFGGMVKGGYQSNNSTEVYSGSVYAGGKDNPFDLVVNFTKRRSDNIKDGEGNEYNYSGANSKSSLVKLGYTFENGHKVSYSYIELDDASRTPWAAKRGLFTVTDYERRRYGVANALLRKTVWRETKDKTSVFKHEYISPNYEWLNTSLTLSHSKSSQKDTRPDGASKYSGSNMGNKSWTDYKTLYAEFKNTQDIELGDWIHTLTYGVQLSREERDITMIDLSKEGREEYNNGRYQPWYMPSGRQIVSSVFVQDEISFGQLTVTPSLRYDYVRNKGTGNDAPRFSNPAQGHDYSAKSYDGLSPRLGLFYKLSPEMAVFSNLSYTFRAPGVDEIYDVGSTQPTSRKLKAEKVLAAEAGVIRSFSNLYQESDNLQIRASLFYTRVDDAISRRLGMYYKKDENGRSVPSQSPYTNIREQYVRGIEAEIFYDSDSVFGQVNLTMMDSKMSGTPRDPHGPDVPVNEVPPPEVNMTLGYKWDTSLKFGWKGKYAHKSDRNARDIDPENAPNYAPFVETPSYLLHHLFLEWKPHWNSNIAETTVNVFAENITNKQYTPYLNEGIAGMGRNIKVSVTQKF
ncbi:TonB-dependent hemoglobin/transferrin/lactoferrin family receptor [Spongorhabdus nitratireducens]